MLVSHQHFVTFPTVVKQLLTTNPTYFSQGQPYSFQFTQAPPKYQQCVFVFWRFHGSIHSLFPFLRILLSQCSWQLGVFHQEVLSTSLVLDG
tara:strand:- start:222 stop:497 length:276 start_codon:yes stop_codon:yes gene_type:complete